MKHLIKIQQLVKSRGFKRKVHSYVHDFGQKEVKSCGEHKCSGDNGGNNRINGVICDKNEPEFPHPVPNLSLSL